MKVVDEERVVRQYESGVSMSVIQTGQRISWDTVKKILDKYKVKRRPKYTSWKTPQL